MNTNITTTNNNGEASLKTDPIKVKELAKEHFRIIAGIPLISTTSTDDMTDKWQLAHLPDDNINPRFTVISLHHLQMTNGMLRSKHFPITKQQDYQEFPMTFLNNYH